MDKPLYTATITTEKLEKVFHDKKSTKEFWEVVNNKVYKVLLNHNDEWVYYFKNQRDMVYFTLRFA